MTDTKDKRPGAAGGPAGAAGKRARPRATAQLRPDAAPTPAGLGGATGAAAPEGSGAGPAPGEAWPGFWLPAALRARVITAGTQWQEVRFARGRRCGTDCPADAPGAVAARWPLFGDAEWAEVVGGLRAARDRAPRGPEYWWRLQSALGVVARRLADPSDSLNQAVTGAVADYTGYSRGMVAAALADPDPWNLGQMVAAMRYQPDKVCGARWRAIPGLPGRVRFFPSKPFDKAAGWVPVAWEMPLYRVEARPALVIGYTGGNVPGDALSMIVLALATTLRGEAPLPRQGPPPAVLVQNSVEEPLLTPLVLSALEEADAELVSMVATLVWDQGDDRRQLLLLAEADLVVAAAGTDVLAGVRRQIGSLPESSSIQNEATTPGCDGRGRGKDAGSARSGATGATEDEASDRPARTRRPRLHFESSSRPRFHAHARKVSFSVIGREVLDHESIDIVALLAGLDATFWDQGGCLSSRVHFVEGGGPADHLPAEYARRLTARMRQIAEVMPRGAWPLHLLHDPFDRYKALEGAPRWATGLQVVSDYDDPFVVVLDERNGEETRLDPAGLAALVEECRTRVVVVRPVEDIMEVPWRYLRMLPRHSVQSLSVAAGRPGQGLSERLLEFAGACGRLGVTTIRTVGKGAFPQPAYSWDGLLPLDLVGRRPAGYFTTIEFDAPFDEMLRSYRDHLSRLARIAP